MITLEIYKEKIMQLVTESPLDIDVNIEIKGRIPTSVSSEFITNKEQGDWAERIVLNAIQNNSDYVVVHYGRSDNLSAGDEGFKEFYQEYQLELNTIGKKPDLLIYKTCDYFDGIENTPEGIRKAKCAIEVRSSSFIVGKYNEFMNNRNQKAIDQIETLKSELFGDPILRSLLEDKKPVVYQTLKETTIEEYKAGKSFDFSSFSSSKDLIRMSSLVKEIKENINIIKKRDYLSITPKVEDIALVNRWIQEFNVPHYYLQVFFDTAYLISFEDILKISSDPINEEVYFSIEKDAKNQGKTTVKIDVNRANLVMKNIKIPEHHSNVKELDRGRLLFYVRFDGVSGELLEDVFNEVIK